MSLAAITQAEKAHAAAVGVPETLTIDGRQCACRVIATRGMRYQEDGGQVQALNLSIIVLQSVLPKSAVLDSSGHTRSIIITRGTETYRLTTGGAQSSPAGVYWILKAEQKTAR